MERANKEIEKPKEEKRETDRKRIG